MQIKYLLKEFLKSLVKVTILGQITTSDELLELIQNFPPSVQELKLVELLIIKSSIVIKQRAFKVLKLKQMCGNTLLPYIQSFITVTDTLKIDELFLEITNIKSQLSQFHCKKIMIYTESLTNKNLRKFFSGQYGNNVFIQCKKKYIIEQLDCVEWAFQHMQQKQRNQLWVIKINNLKDLDKVFNGELGRCKRKSLEIESNIKIMDNIFKNLDTVTSELTLYGFDSAYLAQVALKYCQNLVRLEFFMNGNLYYNHDTIKIEATRLQEIIIYFDDYQHHHYIEWIIQKSKKTLRSLCLRKCFYTDLSIIENFKNLKSLEILYCSEISNVYSIGTLKNLEVLKTDDQSILQQMNICSKEELLAALPKLSIINLTNLGLNEHQALQILKISKKLNNYQRTILPRLASKYLNLQIVGYAYARYEAIDLAFLSKNARAVFIRNYNLFKREVRDGREKKEIMSVFELLEEDLKFFKKYRIYYNHLKDNEGDLAECIDLYIGRIEFYSLSMREEHLFFISNFLPRKVTLTECTNIPYILSQLPHSVKTLSLTSSSQQKYLAALIVTPRIFKKLKLFKFPVDQTLHILTHYATATESVTLQDYCVNEPDIFKLLTNLDCAGIIIQAQTKKNKQLKQFFDCKLKANKFIELPSIASLSMLSENEWTQEYMQSKQFDKELHIEINTNPPDAREAFQQLFMSKPSQKFKRKIINIQATDITLNANQIFSVSDTLTEEIILHGINTDQVAVIALNNCKNLKKLKIFRYGSACQYQELAVTSLNLQEIIIIDQENSWMPLIKDILKKSKDTLHSLECNGSYDISPLKHSKTLRKLAVWKHALDGTRVVIRSLQNLEELSAIHDYVVQDSKGNENLQTFRFFNIGSFYPIILLPQTTKVYMLSTQNSLQNILWFLKMNPQIKELTARLSDTNQAILIEMYPQIKFKFIHDSRLFSLKQEYAYLHPENNQAVAQVATEPDHRVYELLFQRFNDKEMFFRPYIKAVHKSWQDKVKGLAQSSKKMLNLISSFDSFQTCLKNYSQSKIQKLDASHFEQIFQLQRAELEFEDNVRAFVSAYDEAFQLGGNVENTISIIMEMKREYWEKLTRDTYFENCRDNWRSYSQQQKNAV
ncbi:hypothetical protein FGO68_gene16041 [Halteria grandinella]|uniref:Uncharacterized protein n=1 Tax=Halteria grandinella TaxID=5974 RepID=A0A8J8P4V3_HALGN|nr:hypothetical protein FGO68_gene16041 [Halteria grandinella]